MFCTNCGGQNAQGAVFCSSCGNRFGTTSEPQEQSSYFEPAKTKKLSTGALIGIIAGSLSVVLVLVGVITSSKNSSINNSSLDDTSNADEYVPDEPVVTDWAPAGYTQYDDYLAYQFVTDNYEGDCSDCTWWFVKVTAHYDCAGGIYGELNMEDSSGTIVDWSNDTVSALYAGQEAVLEFHHYPYEEGMNGTITKLTCHP